MSHLPKLSSTEAETIKRLERIEKLLIQISEERKRDTWMLLPQAATALGLIDEKTGEPKTETLRQWCRRQEVLQPGKEARKIGRYWQVNVDAIERRLERQQSITRIVK